MGKETREMNVLSCCRVYTTNIVFFQEKKVPTCSEVQAWLVRGIACGFLLVEFLEENVHFPSRILILPANEPLCLSTHQFLVGKLYKFSWMWVSLGDAPLYF